MGPLGTTLIVIVVIAVIFGLWYIGTMNSLRQLEVKVNEADSGIDVALTKRFDVLTKIVNTVKGQTAIQSPIGRPGILPLRSIK